MKIIIIGCGRLGAGLADALIRRKEAVAIVDRDPHAFERLGPSFSGQTVAGEGHDRGVLVKAGIESADALAAVTASDEMNVVMARVARVLFHVPRVAARLYDPRKADVYHRLGLLTISQVTWGVSRLVELLCYSRLEALKSLGNGEVDIVEAEVPQLLVGRTVSEVTVLGEIHPVAVTRHGRTFLPTLGTEFQQGDLIHVAVLASSSERLKVILGLQ